jgi:citrate lyase subunit beta / citryl-CoA lyase
MSAPALNRSWLYVPGNRLELVPKALASGADAVVLDLEDAVPEEEKEAAREAVAELLSGSPAERFWVRVNDAGSERGLADLEAVAAPGLAGVRLPKCERPEDVGGVALLLAGRGISVGIHCLVESALGVERAHELAAADSAVANVSLGEADLAADLGVAETAPVLELARARCVLASRAAGLPSPVQSVYPVLDDEAGLLASCRTGRASGFFGRSAIHPRQVATINEAFTPDEDEVREARVVIDALTAGTGVARLGDGRFVDPAIARRARHTIALAAQHAGAEGGAT